MKPRKGGNLWTGSAQKRKAGASSRTPNALFYETNDTTAIINVKDNLLVIRMGRVEAQKIVEVERMDGVAEGVRFETVVEICGRGQRILFPKLAGHEFGW